MKLKSFLENLDKIDSSLHGLYEKTDEGYVFSGLDDSDYKTKINEFRENNISLKKKIETYEDEKLKSEGRIEELMQQQTDRIQKNYADRIAKLEAHAQESEKRAQQYYNKLQSTTIDSAVTKAVTDVANVRQGAMTDILARASKTWRIDDNGRMVAKNAAGEKLYGSDGNEALTLAEWAENLNREAPFLFESNMGGGAPGGGDAAATAVKTIQKGDKEAFAKNIADIASGKIRQIQ